MPGEANRLIVKVAKELLKPLGFIKLSDRTWTWDGGYWLCHFNFSSSQYARGCYSEVGFQVLFDWRPDVTLGGFAGPREYTELTVPFQFETELRQRVEELMGLALPCIRSISGPDSLLTHVERHDPLHGSNLRLAMLLALAGRSQDAADLLAKLDGDQTESSWRAADASHARLLLHLLEDPTKLRAYAIALVCASRASMHGLPYRAIEDLGL